MTRIAISAIMENEEAADRLYCHVRDAVGPERIGIVDGSKVIAEDDPEAAEMIAAAFAGFLIDR